MKTKLSLLISLFALSICAQPNTTKPGLVSIYPMTGSLSVTGSWNFLPPLSVTGTNVSAPTVIVNGQTNVTLSGTFELESQGGHSNTIMSGVEIVQTNITGTVFDPTYKILTCLPTIDIAGNNTNFYAFATNGTTFAWTNAAGMFWWFSSSGADVTGGNEYPAAITNAGNVLYVGYAITNDAEYASFFGESDSLTVGRSNQESYVYYPTMLLNGQSLPYKWTNACLYVDATTGNDSTARRGDALMPWKTILAAATAASSGDTIRIAPGTYLESAKPTSAHTGIRYIGSGRSASIINEMVCYGGSVRDITITANLTVSGSAIVENVDITKTTQDSIWLSVTNGDHMRFINCSLGGNSDIVNTSGVTNGTLPVVEFVNCQIESDFVTGGQSIGRGFRVYGMDLRIYGGNISVRNFTGKCNMISGGACLMVCTNAVVLLSNVYLDYPTTNAAQLCIGYVGVDGSTNGIANATNVVSLGHIFNTNDVTGGTVLERP